MLAAIAPLVAAMESMITRRRIGGSAMIQGLEDVWDKIRIKFQAGAEDLRETKNDSTDIARATTAVAP